jgi:hypothetical protein
MTHPQGRISDQAGAGGLGLFQESGLLDLPSDVREELRILAASLTGGVRQLWRSRLILPDPLAALVALHADLDQLRSLTRQWAVSGAFGAWREFAESAAAQLDKLADESMMALTKAKGAE